MWKHFTSELQNGVETLKEDWKGIRANVKTIDVSDFRKYEKKDSNSVQRTTQPHSRRL